MTDYVTLGDKGEDGRLACGDPPTLFATYRPGEATVLTIGTKAWCRTHGWQEVDPSGGSAPVSVPSQEET